jgi:hypothetical protein
MRSSAAAVTLLTNYIDDQLLVIDDFLNRARELTAGYTDALGGHGDLPQPMLMTIDQQTAASAYRCS